MTKLYKFQKKGVRLIEKIGSRALLADDMGLGKTIQALEWISRNELFPSLVVCPAALKYNWQREAFQHYQLRSQILEGRKPAPSRGLDLPTLTIINYDILQPWMDYLDDACFASLVIDECQFICNTSAVRTQCTIELGKFIPAVVALSGTPEENGRPADLWPVLHMLKPKVWSRWDKYARKYCAPRYTRWGWKFDGATNLPDLHKKLKHKNPKKRVMIRRLKSEVLDQLPDKTRSIIPIHLSKAAMGRYCEARDDFIKWLKKTHPKRERKARRAKRLVQMGYLRRIAATEKMQDVMSWIDVFHQSDKKIGLFGVHRKILEEYHTAYPKSVLVNGKVTKRKRQRAIDKFLTDPSCQDFFGQMKACGFGLNLQSTTDTMGFIELDWTPGRHIQAEDRFHRIGQTSNVTCYYFTAIGTIEEPLCRIIQEKQKNSISIMDGGNKHADRLSVLDLLEQELLK